MFNTVDETHLNGTTNPFDVSTDPFGISTTNDSTTTFSTTNQFDDQPFAPIPSSKDSTKLVRPRSGKDALLSNNWLAYQHSMDEANLDSYDETSISVEIPSRNPFDLPTKILPDELQFETKAIEPNRSFYDFLGFNLTEEANKSNPFDQTDHSTKKISRHDDDESDDEAKMTFTIKEKGVSSTDETLPLPIPLLPPPPSSSTHLGDKSRRSSTSSSEPDDYDPLAIFRTKTVEPPVTTMTNASLITDWEDENVPKEAKVRVSLDVRLFVVVVRSMLK